MGARRLTLSGLLLAGVTFSPQPVFQPASAGLTAEAIISRLQEQNRQRETLLDGYVVRRIYRLSNELTAKRSEMEVEMEFHSPDQVVFRVLDQSGSGFLAKRVFGRMMKGEQEALTPENKRRSALTPANYEFALLGQETLAGHRAYLIRLKPKREDTYLIAGRVWIDAAEFAIVRAEGQPVKRPSLWTREIEFVRAHRKVGPFWLPDRLETKVEVLLFGTTTVVIETGDYQIQVADAPPSRAAE